VLLHPKANPSRQSPKGNGAVVHAPAAQKQPADAQGRAVLQFIPPAGVHTQKTIAEDAEVVNNTNEKDTARRALETIREVLILDSL